MVLVARVLRIVGLGLVRFVVRYHADEATKRVRGSQSSFHSRVR